MSELTQDVTAKPVSRDQFFRPERGQGNIHFPYSADHEQDWQPYPVDPYSSVCDDHTRHNTVLYHGSVNSYAHCVRHPMFSNSRFLIPRAHEGAYRERVNAFHIDLLV